MTVPEAPWQALANTNEYMTRRLDLDRSVMRDAIFDTLGRVEAPWGFNGAMCGRDTMAGKRGYVPCADGAWYKQL